MQPISKSHIIITVAVVLCITMGVVFRKAAAPVVTIPEPVVTVQDLWPSREVKKETIAESNQYYSIDVSYPSTKDVRLSDHFKTFAQEQVAQFKDDTSWVTDPSIGSAAEGALSLDVTYQETKSAWADTYAFNIVTYTGGAHGLQVTKTFAFDQHGKALGLGDLFSNETKGLTEVALFVQKEITKKNISDATWIAEGAAAKAENYQSFIIGDTGVTFVFDAYQVAPYSAGTQSILVPFSVFKNLANPALFTQ
jgi:hypothetical protein